MAFVHGSQNRCYTSRWFDKFTLNKYWHGDFLLSCMCFPDLQPSSAYSSGITNTNHSILVCYFYIPPPMGNSGWQFIKTCTRQGRSSWWSKSDIEHICPSACVLHSDLSFNAICDAVMCAKGQSIEKLKSVPVQQLSDNIKNELTKDFDYLLIECDGERRQKVTNIECRLFVLVDKYQLSDSHQVAKLEKSVDPEASLSNALLLKDWGHEFLRRLYEYGSIDLNQFAQCFYSSYWYTSQNSSNAWPLPNLNFDLGYAELIGRLNGLLRLLLYEHNVKIMSSDGITDRTEHIYDCVHTGWEPFEPESRLLDSLWRFSSTHSSAIVPITTKDVWRVREIFFYSWGKFKGDEDNKSFYSSDWSVQLEPNTTVICGVSNSGKTTILRALELACLLMTCGLSPSENYCFDENNNTLPPWLHTKLVTLCNCFTKDCSPLSPEILWHKGSDLALIPIFRVVFTHISGTNVTFQLNANGESYAATKINYTLSKSDECVDIEYLYLNLSAEIECGDHTYSLGEESKECIKPSRVDELLEPLVQLVGYNRSLALLTEHVNRFFPIYQFGIEMDPNFCCEKVNSMIELRYSNGSSDRIWDELKYALCITVDSSVQTSDLTKFGEGFLHILRIIIKSLMLKHQVRCSPKLLLLDEPDQSVDRLTLPLLADFLLHQDPSIQCVLTTHSYELIVHASDLAHESESNVGVRHLTYYGIIETSVEQVLRELHCADTFQLMRYIPTERMLHIFIVENTSDEAILTAFISAFGSSEEKTIWKEREKFTLFYLHTRATYEIMLDIQNKLHYILSPSASNICNDYDRVKIFALIDQDINSDVVLKNEEDEWNKFDYYRWKRRCIESYLFDNIKVLDLLADSSDECLPSGILTDIKYLYTWYEELLEVVQKRISDSNEKDQKRNSGYEKEAIDVTNALKIHNLPDIRKFGPYQKVVKNALKSYDRNVNLNAASKRRYSDWLKKKGIVWKSNNPCHQYISNALKAAQDREFEQRNAEPAVKEWFTSRNIVDPSTEEMDTQKAQSELLHWVNAHAVVKTLKKFSSVNLKDLTTLENLFKKRANIDPLDQGIIEMRQMLDHFFGWLSD